MKIGIKKDKSISGYKKAQIKKVLEQFEKYDTVDHETVSLAILMLRHIGYYSVKYCFKVSLIGEIFTKTLWLRDIKLKRIIFTGHQECNYHGNKWIIFR